MRAVDAGTAKNESYIRFVRLLFAERFLLPNALGRSTRPVPVILKRFAAAL